MIEYCNNDKILFLCFKRYMYNGIINVDNLDANEILEHVMNYVLMS